MGARVYEMPAALSKFIQEKTASGIGYLTIVPFAFPVFVMNPTGYGDPLYKGRLLDCKSGSGTYIISDVVPVGEVWEITHIYAEDDVSGTITIKIVDSDALHHTVDKKASTTFLCWDGLIYLTEGDHVRINAPNGNLTLNTFGVKRYA